MGHGSPILILPLPESGMDTMNRRGFLGVLLAIPAALRAIVLNQTSIEPIADPGPWASSAPQFGYMEFDVAADTRQIDLSWVDAGTGRAHALSIPTPKPGKIRVPFLPGFFDPSSVSVAYRPTASSKQVMRVTSTVHR